MREHKCHKSSSSKLLGPKGGGCRVWVRGPQDSKVLVSCLATGGSAGV
jgi:hypothetical protein